MQSFHQSLTGVSDFFLEENKKGSSIGSVMMGEIFEDDDSSFYSENQYKASDMDSFEMTHVPFEILEVLNSSNIHASKLRNLLLQSNEQDRILILGSVLFCEC